MKLPQLSLRDLFWFVLVCGILCGWWVNHRLSLDLQQQRDELRAANRRANASALKLARRAQWIADKELELQSKESEYEIYRKAYFYYREQLPGSADDDGI